MISPMLLSLAVFFNVLYLALAIAAFSHVRTEREQSMPLIEKLLTLSYWWPFYDMYDETGKKLRIYGRIILVMTITAYAFWGFQQK